MRIDAKILKSRPFWGAIILLLASIIGVKVKWLDGPELRVVQLVDDQMNILSARDVYLMDQTGNVYRPDNSGIVRVPAGLISVLETATGRVIQVEEIPAQGPSPYRVVVRRSARTARAQ